VLRHIGVRAVLIALGLGTLSAMALNHFFLSPFSVLLGRMLFVSMVLLLAFTAAGQWPQRRLPR
jgi:hypothetical protein